MNKLIIATMVGLMSMAYGCKSTPPSIESMSKLGSVTGVTTAYVLNKQIEVSDENRNTIIKVMTEVDKYIPNTNETFEVAWTPIVKKTLDEITNGKGEHLPDNIKDRVLKDFTKIISLLDTWVDKRGIRQYQDLTNAFVHSFCSSFLSRFTPPNVMCSQHFAKDEIDSEVEEFLSK